MSSQNPVHHQRLGTGDYSATQLGKIVTVRASNIQAHGSHAVATLPQNPNYLNRPTFSLYVDEVHPALMNLIVLTASAAVTSEGVTTEIAIFDAETGLPEGGDVQPKIVPVKLLKIVGNEA